MAGETIRVDATPVNIATSGGLIAVDSFSSELDNDVNYTGNHVLGDVIIDVEFPSSPDPFKYIHLYRRDLDVKGTEDTEFPWDWLRIGYVGSAQVQDATSSIVIIPAVPLRPNCQFFLQNSTNQNISSGWTLDLLPYGYGVAP